MLSILLFAISFSHPYRPTYLSVDRHGEKTNKVGKLDLVFPLRAGSDHKSWID
jgi:hypothetical protein